MLRALKDSPLKRNEIAKQFQVCPATLYNWQRQEREEGAGQVVGVAAATARSDEPGCNERREEFGW